ERPPLPLACDAEPRRIPPGIELLAITTEMGRPTDMAWGRVISPGPPRLATDITMSRFGGGSPVFDTAGDVVGLTTIRVDPDSPRWHEVEVVPTARVCEALSAARALLASAAEPVAARLPVEPSRPFPDVHTDGEPAAAEAAPPMLESVTSTWR